MNNAFIPNANLHAWPEDRPYIVLDKIRKVFKTTGGEAVALNDISVQVYRGEFVSVIGRSGSGKSTLANMITGIDHPSAGAITVGETVLNGMKESPMSVWRGTQLGIVFQFFQLLPMLSLIENVMLPMDFCGCYDAASREERALTLLELVGLREYAHQLPSSISGGQQQCTAIARALANDPPILIADEPTGNLDSRTADAVMNLFEDLAHQGKTILMVTHDNGLANRTNRKLVISDGELIDEAISTRFDGLDHTDLLALHQQARRLTLKPGQAATDIPAGDFAALVAAGQVRLIDGRGRIVHDCRVGDIFPLPVRPGLRIDMVCSQQVELLLLPRDTVTGLNFQLTGCLPLPDGSAISG